MSQNKNNKQSFCQKLREYVDGEANTPFEFFMIIVIIINSITIGLETSQSIHEQYGKVLFYIDQVCLYLFIFELFIKIIAYNKEFFGEFRIDEENVKFFHINKWNIFDLLIILLSVFGSLPFFSVFRLIRLIKSVKIIKGIKSLRVVKTFKLVNGITNLRIMVKAIIKAFPSVLWTFCLLLIFAYVYAVIGNNIFGTDFPNYFGTLKLSFLSLFSLTDCSSTEIISRFSWSWIYFVSYNFFEASIIMNVIVGVIVNAVNDSRKEIDKEDDEKPEITLEQLYKKIEDLEKELKSKN